MAKSKRRSKLPGLVKHVPQLLIRPVGEAVPPYPEYTRAQVAAVIDEASDLVRAKWVEAGLARQEAADHLFRHLFLNSVRLALDPSLPPPPGVKELRARGGKSFVLSPYDFDRYVRVGALNHHLRDTFWEALPFETKLELVRLVRGPRSFELLEAGLMFAMSSNVGPKAMRDWVNENLPEKAEGRGKPRGLTPKGAIQFTSTVEQLDDDAMRERFADRVAEMEDARARDELLADLEAASKNLAKVVALTWSRVKRKKGG